MLAIYYYLLADIQDLHYNQKFNKPLSYALKKDHYQAGDKQAVIFMN